MAGKKVIQPIDPAQLHSKHFVLTCPPDKSLTHRAVIFSAMAKGKSQILSPLLGADCVSTINVFRELGVKIEIHAAGKNQASFLSVDSPGWDGWKSPVNKLDFGNSGTTARLLLGVFAATPGLKVSCFGDESLSQRPMARVVEPLRKAGATIEGKAKANLLPLEVTGQKLKAMHHEVDKASGQIKSALILSGLNTVGKTSVSLPVGGRDHTEKILAGLGAKVQISFQGDKETISVEGPFRPSPRNFRTPGDPSSAAFFSVLTALSRDLQTTLRGVLVNKTRCGFFEVMKRMGVKLEFRPNQSGGDYIEPVTDVDISGCDNLRATDIDKSEVPTLVDEIPILGVLALFAKGRSHFRGLDELRVKESDRLVATKNLLEAAGGSVSIKGDDLIIEGGLKRAKKIKFDPQGDHRLAMAAAVLASFADGPSEVLDPDCVAVSFPEFFDYLALYQPNK